MSNHEINTQAQSPDVDAAGEQSLDTQGGRLLNWFDGAVVTAEAMPFIGGAIRYGGFAAILATTRDTVLSAGYLAGSTGFSEGAATISAARLLQRGGKVLDLLNRSVGRILPEGHEVSPLAAVVITNYTGAPGLMYAKKREEPTRSIERSRRTGYKATAALVGATALEGTLIAEGIADPTNPRILIPAILGIAAVGFAGRWTKKRLEAIIESEVVEE